MIVKEQLKTYRRDINRWKRIFEQDLESELAQRCKPKNPMQCKLFAVVTLLFVSSFAMGQTKIGLTAGATFNDYGHNSGLVVSSDMGNLIRHDLAVQYYDVTSAQFVSMSQVWFFKLNRVSLGAGFQIGYYPTERDQKAFGITEVNYQLNDRWSAGIRFDPITNLSSFNLIVR